MHAPRSATFRINKFNNFADRAAVSTTATDPRRRLADPEAEAAVLGAADAVITTSTWSRCRLLGRYPLAPDAAQVAEPGVDAAQPVAGTARGTEILCVARVSAHKGHDLMVAALGRIADLDWRCVCVGATDSDPSNNTDTDDTKVLP